MGYNGRNVRMQFGLPKLLPDKDSTLINNQQFRENFGEETVVLAFAIEENPLENLELFNAWYQLVRDLKKIKGVDTIISVSNLYALEKNAELKKFELYPLTTKKIETEEELVALKEKIESLPFYDGFLFNKESGASIMGISIDKAIFNSNDRGKLIDAVLEVAHKFEADNNIQIHYSGLPIIRTVMTNMTKSELLKFVIMAAAVMLLILPLFFRSVQPVVAALSVVLLGVIWSVGIIGLFDYEITILTSIIPPLVIVIGIPNCIFLINKYHSEYAFHGNKAKALTNVIQKIGKATFMTNATTAVGFITFIFTHSRILIEFGIVASISIMMLFVFSILLIPIFFSYLKAPGEKQMKHLDYTWTNKVLSSFENLIINKRKWVYIFTISLVVFAIIGITKIRVTGNISGDLPMNHYLVHDLNFFEEHFQGIIPFEISIDTKQKDGAVKTLNLKKIEDLQNELKNIPNVSKSISIVDGIKFTKQAYYNGDPSKYELINMRERVFFKPYVESAEGDKEFLKTFLDSNQQFARVNLQVADIGTEEMDSLVAAVRIIIEDIFPAEKYNVSITGSSVVFLEGTKYLVKNLLMSLIIAIIVVGGIMALLFRSNKMVVVSIITNLIPLLLTAALMGYFDITLKPSTILVFSISFGISVDDTIHFLAKFRQEALLSNWNIQKSTINALHETGISMTYTSITLFFGFSVFATSQFGGTQALGILVSFTLLTAMFANLILLPSFLLSIENSINRKIFAEPLLDIYDEEEDIDLDELSLNKD